MEGGILILRHLLYLSVKLGGTGLINLTAIFQVVGADCFQDAEHTYSIHISSELGGIEADLYMALSSQIVYLCGLYLTYQLDQRHRVAHVGIVKVEVRCAFEMCDALTVIYGTAADDAMDFVAFG